MITLSGSPVYGGLAHGKINIVKHEEMMIRRFHIESSQQEIERFRHAKSSAISQLNSLYQTAASAVGENDAKIFLIHQMMINDFDYINSIENIITDQMINAETAVAQTCDSFVQMFESMNNSYMSQRSTDIKDISERLILILSGKSHPNLCFTNNAVIAAQDLSPSQTIELDTSKIIAIITQKGSPNSHAAILAKTMKLPAVTGISDLMKFVYQDADVMVDGFEGFVYINPEEKFISELNSKYSSNLNIL